MEELVAFLTLMLPTKGWYCGVALPPDDSKPIQRFYKTIPELSVFLLRMSRQGYNVYWALSSFKEFGSRKATNVLARRCLPMDIDTCERLDGKQEAYKDRVEAYHGLVRFVETAGIPMPVVVSSGYGLHPLWPLSEDTEAGQAQNLLDGLCGAAVVHGLHIDRARTIDLASILRPPGTLNLKYGTVAKVECTPLIEPYHPDQFKHLLEHAHAAGRSKNRQANGGASQGARVDSPIAAAASHMGTDRTGSLATIVEHCGQLGALRARGQDLDEPRWHAGCGIGAYCHDGRRLLSEWGAGYGGHSPDDTSVWIINKCDTWERSATGPTTCAHLATLAPEICATCQLKGQIKTPLEICRLTQATPVIHEPKTNGLRPLPAWSLDRYNKIKCINHNARLSLIDMGMAFRYNQLAHELLFSWPGNEQYTLGEIAIEDNLIYWIRNLVWDRYRFEPSQHMMVEACLQLGYRSKFHPIRSYLQGLTWDGIPRRFTWLTDFLGVEDCEIHRQFAATTLLAGVGRVINPGCKYDQLLIIEGPQGLGKTSTLVTLSKGWYYGGPLLSLPYQRQIEAIMGAWIVEIQELAGFRKTEMEQFNAFFSQQTDKTRLAYDRIARIIPRQCLPIATTNDEVYLRGLDGNRRCWSVRGGQVPHRTMTPYDADQLWAETYHAAMNGIVNLTLPQNLWEIAAQIQESRRTIDPWEDILMSVEGEHVDQDTSSERISTRALLLRLNISTDRATDRDTKRISKIMRANGWSGPDLKRVNGVTARCYHRTLTADQIEERKARTRDITPTSPRRS
jgi:Virulence-associated protein E